MARKCFGLFCGVFKGLEEGTVTYEDYFYPSYQEKLSHSKERILGLLVEKREGTKGEALKDTGGETGKEADREAEKGTGGETEGKWLDYRITPIHNLKDREVEYLIYMQDEQEKSRSLPIGQAEAGTGLTCGYQEKAGLFLLRQDRKGKRKLQILCK